MGMEDAANIVVRNELRNVALLGMGDLVPAFPQFGGHKLQAQRPVDFFLRLGCHKSAAFPEPACIEFEPLLPGISCQRVQMPFGASGAKQRCPVVRCVRHVDLELTIRFQPSRCVDRLSSLSDQREVSDQFASAPQIARDGDALQRWPALLKPSGCIVQQRRSPMHMHSRFSGLGDSDVLQDFGLQRSAEPFGFSNAIFARGFFQIDKRRDTERLIDLEHLVRTKPGDRQHLQHAGGKLLAHRLQAGMRPLTVDGRDNVSDRFANAGDFGKSTCRDHVFQRLTEGGETVGGTPVGPCTIGVAAAQAGALGVFAQNTYNIGRRLLRHVHERLADFRQRCVSGPDDP